MNTKPRIELHDNGMSAIVKITEGNPGALTVCLDLLTEGEKIDPYSVLGGFAPILELDTLGIYGSRIWLLYKDVCNEDLAKMMGVLRAVQLGYFSKNALITAIDNPTIFDFTEVLAKIKERLPLFNLDHGLD